MDWPFRPPPHRDPNRPETPWQAPLIHCRLSATRAHSTISAAAVPRCACLSGALRWPAMAEHEPRAHPASTNAQSNAESTAELEALRAGDRAAFERLVRRHHGALLDERPGWRERIVLQVRLWLCPPCATFVRQYRRLFGLPAAIDTGDEVSAAEVERIMQAIDEATKPSS